MELSGSETVGSGIVRRPFRRKSVTGAPAGSESGPGYGLSDEPSRAAAVWAAAVIFVVSLLASTLAYALVASVVQPRNDAPVGPAIFASLVTLEASQALLVLGYTARWGSFAEFRIRGPWLRGIASGIPLGFLLQSIAVIVFLLVQRLVPGFRPEDAMGPIEREFSAFSSELKAAFAVAAGIVGPFAEELLFRGLLLYGFEARNKKRGRIVAIVLTSLVFGLVHLNAWGFLVFFALGALLAWITLMKGSIAYAVGCHIGFNMAALAALAMR